MRISDWSSDVCSTDLIILKQNMAKSQETVNKKEKEKKRLKKKQDKEQKREERKSTSSKGKSLEEMYAYVDENGDLTFTPPDPKKRKVINQEDIELGVSKRSEERRVGKECVSTCRYRCSRYHKKKKKKKK